MGSNNSIDGLISGLDTTTMIAKLMQIEQQPQALLQKKSTAATTLVSALQSLNVKVASLAANAQTAAKPESWDAYKASSSASSVTATASSTARPSSVSFTVDNVASTQSSLVTLPASYTSTTPSFTIIRPGGSATVTAASTSIGDIVDAFNSSTTAGVKAVAINVGTATTPDYRLQLTSTDTGVANGFTVSVGTAAEVTAGTATPLSLTSLRTASDAKITLWGGTSAQSSITSGTNTFSGVITGVDFSVSQVETTPVEIGVTRDDAALTKLASGLVGSLNVVFSEISSRTDTTTTTAADGSVQVTGGLFSGDTGIRNLQESVMSSAMYGVDSHSPTEIGISINADGTLAFDSTAFTAALAKDPANVQSILTGLAGRVATTATAASDPVTGTLTSQITGTQGEVKDLGEQIANWTDRLALRETALKATWSALETQLSALKSQGDWMTSQLSALTSSSSSK